MIYNRGLVYIYINFGITTKIKTFLSGNPNAIDILKTNQDKIIWYNLSKNPNAIELLEANQDKINWYNLSLNLKM